MDGSHRPFFIFSFQNDNPQTSLKNKKMGKPIFLSLVRPTGLEPVRPADTSTSSLPVCQFQHSRTSYHFQFFVNDNILLASDMFVNTFLRNRTGFSFYTTEANGIIKTE